MPRVRGGRGSRGFRGRGRRDHYQPRAQYHNIISSPPSGPVSLPPASTSYVIPVERLSNQTPGVVPTEGTTANVERLASTPALRNALYAQSNTQVLPPANHEGTNPIVPLLAEQNIPSTSAQNVSAGSTHNSEQLQQQVHHEPQVEYSASENSEVVFVKVDTSESESGDVVSVGETSGKQKDRDRSSSPTDLYLYGPQSDSIGEPESVLGKRKEPPQDGPGDREEREGEEDEQEHKDTTKKPKVSFSQLLLDDAYM